MTCALIDPNADWIAVLGAFEALSVRAPSIQQSTIAGVSVGVLALLFLVQPLGTHRIGFLYAPILFVWFLFSTVIGINNITVTGRG